MVLQTEHYPGAYQQQSYSMYQVTDGRIPDGCYSNFLSMNTAPMIQYSIYPVGPHGSGTKKDHGGGMVAPGMPNNGGYGHSYNHMGGSTMQNEHSSYASGTNYSQGPIATNHGYNMSYWTQKNLDAE